MSRAIRLTRYHALNWYGYRDTIPVNGNLLVAGVTGSGKSILMDLLQFVLVGDLRLVKFNQSATGAHSDRSLKGYCLGDTKQEEAGVTQYMRDSAISYVALEFTWPGNKKFETWGFRIEFASAAETQGRVTPFFIPAALERSDFLDEEKRPLDYSAFKQLVESHVSREGMTGRLYATIDEYTRDLQQPAHLNFDYKILRGLLPTAMSFTFLRSFNDFCRQFILSAERLDVRDVTDSYRAFQRYEKDLIQLNDQFQRLREIHALYAGQENLRRDAILARYLEAELRYQALADQLQEDEAKLGGLRAACAEEDLRLAELGTLIPKTTTELDDIKNAIRDAGGALYLELKRQNSDLVSRIEQRKLMARTLEDALAVRVRQAQRWLKDVTSLALKLDPITANAVEQAVDGLEAAGISGFQVAFSALRETAQKLMVEVGRLAQPTKAQLAEIRNQLGALREQLAALATGKLPFPTRLLSALNRELLQRGTEPPARHLRELCEVNDERWRPALEVAFTRKFAVVVPAEQYEEAERIYHALKDEAAREALIHPAKALKGKRQVKPGSLAEKLTTTHPVAAAIVSQLFGDLMCVENRGELRDHDAAIMPDGFSSRGAFVERSRHYDNLPFIGQRGLEQQRTHKEQQRAQLEAEERKIRPLADEVDTVQRQAHELFEAPASLWQEIALAGELPKLQQQLSENIDRLKGIDREQFDSFATRQAELESTLRVLAEEQRKLDRSPMRQQFQQQEAVVRQRATEASARQDAFERAKETDVSPWVARLTELRDEVLAKSTKAAAADRFKDRFYEFDKQAGEQWQKLIACRRELAMAHPKFDDLACEATDNAAYERQLARLEESDIPDYSSKAERERKAWEKLFRTQVLEKLRNALFEIENTRLLLNNSLKRPIGNNRYRVVKWENPDFALYHKLLDASAAAREDELFFATASVELKEACDQFLQALIDEDKKGLADQLLDYRHYYEYDMEVDDLGEDGEVKATSRVDRQSGKFSGGENQSPYFIAILASYLRAYKRHDTRSKTPSLSLVPIDEAFSKLSGERIKDCIEAMKSLDLQGIFSMSTGNIPYAFEHCDSLVVVAKEEKRIGKRPQIRNVPVSLHKDSPDAKRLLGLDD